jgi:cyclohexanone monooxygenase
MNCAPTATPEIDLPALRERYRQEADRRRRPEGFAQYIEVTDELEAFLEFEPYEPIPERAALADEVDAVVLGGGFAGLIAAGRLAQAGVKSIRIVDRAGDFGGTWYWNRYPGVQCDVESYSYLPLLEELGYMPKDRYSYGTEIFEYCQKIGRHFGLYEYALFGTIVKSLRWDDVAQRWRIGTNRGDDFTARYVVMAPGPLNRPKLPGVPGIERFRGHSFHTTRWDYDYTGGTPADPAMSKLAGKRVAIIGTGATAVQCVPHLAKYADQLYVFQRTPSYIDDRGNRPTDPDWAKRQQPGWQAERMSNFHTAINGIYDKDHVDLICDGWSEINRNIQARRRAAGWPEMTIEEVIALREIEDYRAMERIRQRVDFIVEDPATAEMLKPWYRFLCKRPCFNDEYLPAFNRPNVTLIDVSEARGITGMTETGIIANGVEYEIDCIIYASGFETTTDLRRRYGIDIIEGRGGLSLYEHWKDGFRTLHGMSVHQFPGMFFTGYLQGGVSGSITLMYDQQGRHIAHIIGEAMARGGVTVEPSREAEAAWVKTIRDNLFLDVPFWESCTPGYNNNEGLEVTRYTIFGEPYGPGYDAFDELLRDWRAKGDFAGLLFQPSLAQAHPVRAAFTATDLTPRIGTEIKADIATLLSGAIAKELRELLAKRGVLLFRGLDVNDEQQLQFARTLGVVRMEHGLAITKITPDKNQSPIFADYTKGTYYFHIDGTYTDTPGLASILRAVTVAPEGGQTEFANTYAMYEDLSEEEQKFLDGLEVVHSGETIQRLAFPDPTPEQLAAWGEEAVPPRQHPLVWQHRSGRKSLLLAYSAKYIAGMEPAESDALLARLLARAEQPQYIYHHDWRVGDLLIWDNTGTMHRVVPFDLDCGRFLHRVTLLGEEQITGPTQQPARCEV